MSHVKRALALPDKRTVDQWAEQSIVLDASNAEPGPINLNRTPYVRGILQAFGDWRVREITILAGTQCGKTQSMLCMLGYAIDQKPMPSLWVLPTEAMARRFSRTRIKPLIESSATLAGHLAPGEWSIQTLEYRFMRMFLMLAWANSPAALSSQPIGDLFLDEIDKYPFASHREAEPLKLARERVRTFFDHKIVKTSTPTVPDGPIMKEWEKSVQQTYRVPCPHCGMQQMLIFSQVKVPDGERDPARIRGLDLAWYECAYCNGRIDDYHKPQMLLDGEWKREKEDCPDPSHMGFKLNSLYSPWLTWSEIAAEFFASKDDPGAYRNFRNSWEAEPWEERISGISKAAVEALTKGAKHERGEVPPEAQMVCAGVDVHDVKGLYWSVWAFGAGRRMWLIDHGKAFSWGDLERDVTLREYVTEDGVVFTPFIGVDSGYGEHTPKVYDFTRVRYPQWRPTKGEQTITGAGVKETPIDYTDHRTGRRFRGFSLLLIDTNYFKDLLAGQLHTEGEASAVKMCRGVDESFLSSLRSEHKVREKGKDIWKKRYAGAPNHDLDTVIIAMGVAERLGWGRLAPLEDPEGVDAGVKAGGAAGPDEAASLAARHRAMKRH